MMKHLRIDLGCMMYGIFNLNVLFPKHLKTSRVPVILDIAATIPNNERRPLNTAR